MTVRRTRLEAGRAGALPQVQEGGDRSRIFDLRRKGLLLATACCELPADLGQYCSEALPRHAVRCHCPSAMCTHIS
jgi:hypothetical protein